jgi:HK97 family phage major capsid protein
MAITAAKAMSDFSGFLTPEQSAPIFEKAAQISVVQRLAQRVPLGISGVDVPVFTGTVAAGWVAESGTKPATEGGMSLLTMSPKKLAAIFVQSAEVVRANPGTYMDVMRDKVAEAFAIAFDKATLHGTSTPFDATDGKPVADTTKSVELGSNAQAAGGVWQDLVNGLEELVDADKELNGFAISPRMEPRLLGAVDTTGHPIFVADPVGPNTALSYSSGRLIGRPVAISKAVHADATVEGFGGDWTQVAWGAVGGISYSVSTEATVTINGSLVSLWEKNLVAVLAEAEYGWVNADPDAFVIYHNATGS